jgi:predicted nucleic acid-binding protein
MMAFVDSSVWFAAVSARDHGNERAKSTLASAGELLLDTWLLIRNNLGWTTAEAFVQEIRAGIAALEAPASQIRNSHSPIAPASR